MIGKIRQKLISLAPSPYLKKVDLACPICATLIYKRNTKVNSKLFYYEIKQGFAFLVRPLGPEPGTKLFLYEFAVK